MSLSDATKQAICRFQTEVYARSHIIDPEGERDWNDMAYGFLLACGAPQEEAEDWSLLSALTCGTYTASEQK